MSERRLLPRPAGRPVRTGRRAPWPGSLRSRSAALRPGAPTRVFLSGIRSRSHLVYASAYLRVLQDAGGPATVVNLGLGSFLGQARVTPADLAAGLDLRGSTKLVLAAGGSAWHGEPGERLVYLGIGAPGIKPYLHLVLANRARLHCVVVDEGLGSYGGWRARWAAARRQGGRTGWSLVRAVAVSAASRALPDERWTLYRRDRSGWQVDERVAAAFRRPLPPAPRPAPVPRSVPQQAATGERCRRAVLVCQPWVELGQLSAARYLAVLHAVRAACASAGLALTVRPHPAEDRVRLAGFDLDLGRDPAEQDPAVLTAAAVLGFTSTALVNLAAVHARPVVRIDLPELHRVDAALSRAQRSLLATFLPAPVPLGRLTARLADLAAAGASPVLDRR